MLIKIIALCEGVKDAGIIGFCYRPFVDESLGSFSGSITTCSGGSLARGQNFSGSYRA
jgi:hypothetical protein